MNWNSRFEQKAKRAAEARGCLIWLRISRSRCLGGSGVIYKVFEFFAGLEVRDLLGGHFHFFSGLGIAPHASAAFPRAKTPEAANLDLFTFLQSRDDVVENG